MHVLVPAGECAGFGGLRGLVAAARVLVLGLGAFAGASPELMGSLRGGFTECHAHLLERHVSKTVLFA